MVEKYKQFEVKLTLMATTVKMAPHAKDKLEALQAEIKLRTGRKVTQQELLEHLVERAYATRDELVESYRDDFEGLSEEEIEAVLAGTFPSGDPVDEEDIDRVLYDEEQG